MITDFKDLENKSRKLIFRRLFLSVNILLILHIFIYIWAGSYNSAITVATGLFIFTPLTLWLGKNNFEKSARGVFNLSCYYLIFFASLGFGHQGRLEIYCFPALLLGFLIFNMREKVALLLNASGCFVCWYMIYSKISLGLPLETALTPEHLSIIENLSFFGSFAFSICFQYIFVMTSLKTRDKEIEILRDGQNQVRQALQEKIQSEMMFEKVIASMNEGLIVLDNKSAILHFNQAALQLLDRSYEQLSSRVLQKFDWHAIREDGSLFKVSEYPSNYALEKQKPISNVVMGLKRANDDMMWLQVSAAPFKLDNDTLVVMTFSNITEQKNIEQQLVDAQSIAKIGSWKLDLRSKQQIWTSEHYKIFEIEKTPEPDKLNELFESRFHAKDFAALEAVMQKSIETGKEFVFNHVILFEEGKRIKYLQCIGKVTKDKNGSPLFLTGTCRDRTVEIEMEKSLESERMKSIHTAKLASLGEMSAGVAHEINNPLAIIAGNIDLLSTFKENPEKFKAKSDAILKATERIAKIVSGLRKFSRTTEQSTYKQEPLATLVSEALVITQTKVKKFGVKVVTNIQNEDSIYCDAVEIEQVLVNLINNAVDAIKNHSEKWVVINGLSKDKRITLQVIDSGPGISAEIEQKLFQPFFTTKLVGEGTGLGLSISKGILDQHKASISLNRKFMNTCFEIKFATEEEVTVVA